VLQCGEIPFDLQILYDFTPNSSHMKYVHKDLSSLGIHTLAEAKSIKTGKLWQK
jgi:hypothetical protein